MEAIKKDLQNIIFEVKDKKENKIVYQRIIKPKGRSKKEVAIIVNNLPTATVYSYSMEEFEKFKAIEKKLRSEIKETKKDYSLRDKLFSFLEI